MTALWVFFLGLCFAERFPSFTQSGRRPKFLKADAAIRAEEIAAAGRKARRPFSRQLQTIGMVGSCSSRCSAYFLGCWFASIAVGEECCQGAAAS